MVVDGQVAGTWERKSGRGKEIVKTMLFVTLSEDLKTGLKEEAERFERFLEREVVLE